MFFGQFEGDFLLCEHGGGVEDSLLGIVIKVAITENVNEYFCLVLTLERTGV
jgi:hypothetical protein